MNEADSWLTRYEEAHGDLTHPGVYWAAVPMIVLGTVGLLWLLPIPDEFFEISPLLNWGSAFLMVTAVYYFIISVSLAIGMLPFILGVATFQVWLTNSDYTPLRVIVAMLVAGVIGLWLGRFKKGSMGAIFEDLQLMMIGPAWLLSVIYRRIGIPY
jgi:hypothetical protein